MKMKVQQNTKAGLHNQIMQTFSPQSGPQLFLMIQYGLLPSENKSICMIPIRTFHTIIQPKKRAYLSYMYKFKIALFRFISFFLLIMYGSIYMYVYTSIQVYIDCFNTSIFFISCHCTYGLRIPQLTLHDPILQDYRKFSKDAKFLPCKTAGEHRR